MSRQLEPIGVIRSPFATKDDTPIQGAFWPEAEGSLELFAEYAEGLADVDEFSHNGIGLTVVRLLSREGATLTVGGIDVLDETPLLDIKPHIPRFDSFPDASEGWLAGRPERPKPTGRE